MGKNDRTVYRRPDGQWANKRNGAERATSLHDTQRDAAQAAKTQAKRDRAEVTIKGVDGKFRSKDSYGNDPHPPKDSEH